MQPRTTSSLLALALLAATSSGVMADAAVDRVAAAMTAHPVVAGAGIDAVRVVWGVWPYRDPARLVAERIGADGARTTITTTGNSCSAIVASS